MFDIMIDIIARLILAVLLNHYAWIIPKREHLNEKTAIFPAENWKVPPQRPTLSTNMNAIKNYKLSKTKQQIRNKRAKHRHIHVSLKSIHIIDEEFVRQPFKRKPGLATMSNSI